MKLDNNWFYDSPPKFLFMLLIYVKGDALVLLPFLVILALSGMISTKLMVLLFAVYLTVRYLGEMIYWLLQQFLGGKYRPYDYGLKSLDNNAIYILYQLTCLCWTVVGLTAILYILFF
jgi:hypothetical protein